MGEGFWFVCVCVPKTLMHLLRPGDRGKSVLRVWDGRRGGAEPEGGLMEAEKMEKRRERKKKKNSGYYNII